jgi:hypothetical protein
LPHSPLSDLGVKGRRDSICDQQASCASWVTAI